MAVLLRAADELSARLLVEQRGNCNSEYINEPSYTTDIPVLVGEKDRSVPSDH